MEWRRERLLYFRADATVWSTSFNFQWNLLHALDLFYDDESYIVIWCSSSGERRESGFHFITDPRCGGFNVCLDHFFERRGLKIGRALDGIDQIRDEIGAALIDVFDLRPGLFHAFVLRDGGVVGTLAGAVADERDQPATKGVI